MVDRRLCAGGGVPVCRVYGGDEADLLGPIKKAGGRREGREKREKREKREGAVPVNRAHGRPADGSPACRFFATTY